MKTLFPAVVLSVSMTAAVLNASPRLTPDDYLNLLRIDLRATKAEVVADAMELSREEADVFWPIYREYDEELSKLNAERISLMRDFTANFASIDENKAREISRRTFDFMKKRLDLLEKCSRRLEKSLSPVVAARFAQIENHLLMLVDVQLASDFPLIPRQAVVSQIAP